MGRSKRAKPKTTEDEEFTYDIVQDLGGTKADYEMLQNLDDAAEAVDHKADFETEPINKDDIRSFMDEIGLGDLRRDRKIKEEEEKEKERESRPRKIKLAVMPGFEDKEDETPEKSATEEEVSEGESSEEEASEGESEEEVPKVEVPKKAPKEEKKKKELKKAKKIKEIQDAEVSSTTTTPLKRKKLSLDFVNTHRPRKQLLVKPEGKWYSVEFPKDPVTFEPASNEDVDKLEKFAARLLEQDVALNNKQEESRRKSDVMWMRTVLKSGTLQDKMAALTILIQDSPIHNLASLDTLINMAKKKGRREALLAIDTMKELFLSDLLPDRKLKAFDQHPLPLVDELASGNKDMRDKRLLVWYFEAQLRERYAAFVKALEGLAQDTVSGPKKKAVGIIHEMLSEKPEQEKALLSLLVNKLGDPDYKIAAQTAHLLSKLVGIHPNMKFVVVLEVERLLYRPNVSSKAQYYAVCFLNQLVLSNKEQKLAARLISIYFSFFKAYVKRGEVDSKMLSALLMGVNRAYPYAKVEKTTITEQMDTLYKIVHIVNFNTSIQALMLLYQVVDANDKAAERYYMALYRKMLDPALKMSSKQTMFLNLLFKSMKNDPSDRRVQAFLKRLLQVCCHQSAPFVCASLILTSELVKHKKQVIRITQAAEDSDDEEEHFVDAPEDEGQDKPEGESSTPSAGSDEVKVALQPKGGPTVSSWVHRKNTGEFKDTKEYDPMGRNPQFCHAETECTWELQRLSNHFHPTVAMWAKNVLQGKSVYYKSDPLQDFTLIRFLDRFVYRNPKKKESGGEVVLSARKRLRGRELATVNSEEYLELGEEGVPVDERFFFRYFNQKAAKANAKKIEDQDSNASDVSDDEFDDYLDTFEKGLMEEGKRELDFASELQKQKSKKKKKKDGEESDSDDSEGEDGDLSDEEVDFGDLADEFGDLMDDDEDGDEDGEEGEEDDDVGFDEDDIAFSDEDDLMEFDPKKGKKGKRPMDDDEGDDIFLDGPPRKKGKPQKSQGMTGLFASADEFAHLMDENASSKTDMTGYNAFANKDNAHAKQLKWEADRDRWMNDGGRRGRKPGPKKPFKKGGSGKGAKGGKGGPFKKGRK